MDGENDSGLSSGNRNYIVTLIFVGLLIFGPVDPYGLVVRIGYLFAVPTAIWLGLPFVGRALNIDARTNDHINRALTASAAGALAVAACLSFTAANHSECTKYARDGDGGRECVGETVTRPGPDIANALMLTFLAGIAFWIAVARKPD